MRKRVDDRGSVDGLDIRFLLGLPAFVDGSMKSWVHRDPSWLPVDTRQSDCQPPVPGSQPANGYSAAPLPWNPGGMRAAAPGEDHQHLLLCHGLSRNVISQTPVLSRYKKRDGCWGHSWADAIEPKSTSIQLSTVQSPDHSHCQILAAPHRRSHHKTNCQPFTSPPTATMSAGAKSTMSRDMEELTQGKEDISKQVQGHKANLSNPSRCPVVPSGSTARNRI